MKAIFLILFSILVSINVYAQAPVVVEDEGSDTIYVEEEPLVYTQSLTVEEEKTVKFYMNGYANVFNNYSSYDPCPTCEEFLDTYKSAITPEVSYGIGLSLLYAPKNWVLETGVDYALIKEKFNFTNSAGKVYSSNNKTSYLDIKLTGGYWFWRDKNLCSVILQGGLAYNHLLGASGLVNDFYNPNNALELGASGKLRDTQLSGVANAKFIFRPQSRLKVSLEPYYMASLANITQQKYPYLELYNRVGLKAGIIFSL